MGRNWGVFLAWFLSMTITHGYPDLPDPTKTTAGCGQLKRSYVCDPSNMLTAHEGKAPLSLSIVIVNSKI